jgi:hypothetical protein
MELAYFVGHRGALMVDGALRQPGAAVPEAATWPNLAVYLQGGHVVAFPVGAAPVIVMPPAGPQPVATPTAPTADSGSDGGADNGSAALPATLAGLTVAQAEPLILATDDLDVLDRWHDAESTAETPRKGILVPLAAKIDALTAPQG